MPLDSSPPRPDEARAALADIAATRRTAAATGRRPVWLDAVFCVGVGGVVTAGLLGHRLIAAALLVVVVLGFQLLGVRTVRRRGKVEDMRATAARGWRFLAIYAVLFVLMQIPPPQGWQPWWALGVGAVAGVLGFVWVRWEDRYQTRRLAAGDHERYDLL